MISRKQNLSGSIIVAVWVFFAGAAIALLQPAPEAFADVSVQDKEVLAAVDKVAPTVEEIAKKLWDLSEVSLLEIKSSAYLKDLLKKNGFTITSEKAAGVPTSFVAEFGEDLSLNPAT